MQPWAQDDGSRFARAVDRPWSLVNAANGEILQVEFRGFAGARSRAPMSGASIVEALARRCLARRNGGAGLCRG